MPRSNLALITLAIALCLAGSLVKAFGQSPSLGEALDSTDLLWVTDPNGQTFVGALDPNFHGGDAAFANLNNGQKATISTSFEGSGFLDFSIGGGDLQNWSASVDGQLLDLSSGSWPRGFRVEGAGLHSFQLQFTSTRQTAQTVSIDHSFFTPDQNIPLGTALDLDESTWTSEGDHSWITTSHLAFDAIDNIWSGNPGEAQVKSLKTVVEGPAELSFRSQIPRRGGTRGRFLIDDIELINLTQSDSWQMTSIIIGEGSHTIQWEVTQQEARLQTQPASGLWLDQVTVTPHEIGLFSHFGHPFPGTVFQGLLTPASPGFGEQPALGLDSDYCNGRPLRWTLPPSDALREISFAHRNASGGSMTGGYSSVAFESQNDWQRASIIVPPTTQFLIIYATSSNTLAPALIDDLVIDDLETIPIPEILGPIASNFTLSGWYGSATFSEDQTPVLFSPNYGSTIQGTITGPAQLTFEAIDEGNGQILLLIDGKQVLTSNHSTDSVFSHTIPPGEHEIAIIHAERFYPFPISGSGSEARATLHSLKIDPITQIPLAQLSETTGIPFETSGISNHSKGGDLVSWPTFFSDANGVIQATAAPDQLLSLATRVSGPALFCFERQIITHQEEWPEIVETVFPSCTTGTITITVGPGPDDPGAAVFLDDRLILQSEATNQFLLPLDSVSLQPVEPMDPTAPDRQPGGYLTKYGHRAPGTLEGWEKVTLYLGPGSHDIIWKIGAAPNDPYGYHAQSRQLKLANLEISPVIPAYQTWSEQMWIAAPEVENPDLKLGPWRNPLADPDRDGANNALEFAFGTNPRSSTSRPRSPVIETTHPLSVLWSDPSPDARWKIYLSNDLKTWTEEGVVTTFSPLGLRAQSTQPTPKTFFILEADVTLPEDSP